MNKQLKCSIKRNVKPPCRAHIDDAGIDLFVPVFDRTFIKDLNQLNVKTQRSYKIDLNAEKPCIILNPQGRIKIPSGTYFNIPQNNCLGVFQKTSVGSTGLFTGGRIADSNFHGQIILALINVSDEPIYIYEGQKFIQLVLMPVRLDQPQLVPFDELYIGKESQRGQGAFGSTGQF